MKEILFRLYLTAMKTVGLFVKIKPRVAILNEAGRSGSNGYLFYKWLKENHPEIEARMIEPWPSSHLPLKTWRYLASCQWLLATHQPFKMKRKQILIEFWHGVPLKRMGTMAHNTKYADNHRNQVLWQKDVDAVTSSSDLYETLMSSCMGIASTKYRKVGFPRLDFLKKPAISKAELLTDLFGVTSGKVGIYMPTFRYELEDQAVLSQIENGNFLTMPDFNLTELEKALAENDEYLVVKLHPYEMRLLAKQTVNSQRIAFINQDYLDQKDLDLYEILGNFDFLMTDFSSIYFDYLTLDRPIIFISNYQTQYQKTRGFLMAYEQVTPGEKVHTQAELCQALRFETDYRASRQRLRELTMQVEDSCPRVYQLMRQLCEKNIH